jgi:hypothetical protein
MRRWSSQPSEWVKSFVLVKAICLLHLLVLLVLLTHVYVEIKIQNCLCAVMIWFTLVRLQLLLIVRSCVFIVKPHEFGCNIC